MGNDECSFYKIADNIKITDKSIFSAKTTGYDKYIGSYSVLGSQKLTIHSVSKDSICISMNDYGIENRTIKMVNNMAKTECELFDLLIELKDDRVVVGCSKNKKYLKNSGEMWSNIYMLKLG